MESVPKFATPPNADGVPPKDATDKKTTEAPKNALLSTKANPSPRDKKEACYCKPDSTPVWKMIAEIAAILIGGYVAWVYSGQLTQMIESNKINRDALTSVQRAFVTFSTIQYNRFVNPNPSGEQWEFNGELVNNGATPAIQAMQRFVVDELPNGLSEERFTGDFSEQKNNVGTVGPKETYRVGPSLKTDQFVFMNQQIDLEHPERAKSIQIEKNIYFWGWAAYRDVFPDTPLHITEFCVTLSGMSINRARQIQISFSKCPQHNCTDKYCKDYETIKNGLGQ